jgi:predicted neuraminidase
MNATPTLSRKMPRWLAAAFFIGALSAAFWRIPVPAEPAFSPPPAASLSALPAAFSASLLPRVAEAAYAASLTQLPDGRIALAWLAGSHDDRTEDAIWLSILGKEGWRAPQIIGNRESTAGGTFANVRKLGNPVLYAEGSWLHLWYASAAIAGWAGSSLNHSVSTDTGKTWTKPTRLQVSPFANVSSLIDTPPIPLADGGLALAIHHDLMARHGEWLRLSPTGQILDKVRMTHSVRTLQPAPVVLDTQRAMAFLRDAGPPPGRVQVVTTNDAGLSWQEGEPLSVANPNAPVAALRLSSGRLLLAGNPQDGREALLLWISSDEGKTWQASRTVEAAADGGAEFSSPALLLGRDGRIHLAYTWRRQDIKYTSFSEAWLDGAQP